MILSLFIPNFFLCLGNGEVATNTGTRNYLYKWDKRQKWPSFWQLLYKSVHFGWHIRKFSQIVSLSFVFPMALMVTGPCLFGDCLLRTESRANLPLAEICFGPGADDEERWGAGGDKYRVSRIMELITIMKYYCHVSRWSHHAGRWSDKHHQNPECLINIWVTS